MQTSGTSCSFDGGGTYWYDYAGLTTTVANTKMVLLSHNWDNSGTLTPPRGAHDGSDPVMTERFDELVYIADEGLPVAGGTGLRTMFHASNGPFGGFLIALKPTAAPVTGYTVTATAGTYAMTGTDATMLRTYRPAAASSSYTITGTDATPTKAAVAITPSRAPFNPAAFLPFLVR
jgi:hypothetical protein